MHSSSMELSLIFLLLPSTWLWCSSRCISCQGRSCQALVPGDHGTTYGGNPLACAAATKVFELFEKQHILDNVKEVSAYLEEKLDELVAEYDFIIERRGLGLMQGLELSINPKDVIANALDNGLILFSAGTNVIRMVPPLVITKADVDEMITKLKEIIPSN